jgi:SAM-dependent methyltransferase
MGASPSHDDIIRDQFTRQASSFAEAPAVRDVEALRILMDAARVGPDDAALDVACGPGIVACALARVARRVVGVDLTPAMIEKARQLQAEQGLTNAEFHVGGVSPLPYRDGEFSVVTCRYAFHHFERPEDVLREMRRVCAPGGTVAVADVAVSDVPVRALAFNRMERLRDPSHVRALTLGELETLFERAGLPAPLKTFYGFPFEVEALLAHSSPHPGDVPRIRGMFAESLEGDGLGMRLRREGNELHGEYPIVILASTRDG